jgi:hypothetical protein
MCSCRTAASDAVRLRRHCLAVLRALLLSAAAVLSFRVLHDAAVTVATDHGRNLRGGVGWGITVQLAFYLFGAWVLLQNVAVLRWPTRRLHLFLAVWLAFAVLLTLLANPIGPWSHPYRFLLLQLCALAGFALSLAGQCLWPPRPPVRQGSAR